MYQSLKHMFCYSVIIKPSYYSCFKKLRVNNIESDSTTLYYFICFRYSYTKLYDKYEELLYELYRPNGENIVFC